MSDVSCVVTEGRVKYREGKKWKRRWCILRKPSPVADQLNVQLFKVDVKDVHKRQPKTNFNLEGFFGVETGFSYDKETNVLAIICQKQITLFSFENRDNLIQFEIKIRRSLGEEDQFKVQVTNVPNNSKLPLDDLRMHIHGQKFCLTNGIPPKVLAAWQISDLRRFGVVDKKFIFEGGSNCGKGGGVHAISSEQAELINEIVSLASLGKTASCRKFIIRRSQLYDYHLDPVSSSFNDNSQFRDFQSWTTAGEQLYLEDKRSKRHSLSFTDFSHASAYNEKLLKYKTELELEKRKYLKYFLYDVPPSRVRKVDNCSLYLNTKHFQQPDHFSSQNSQEVKNVSNILSHKLSKECVDNRIEQWIEAEACMSSASGPSSESQMSISSGDNSVSTLGQMVKVSASAPSLCGYGVYSCNGENSKSLSVTSVPSRIEEESESCRRLELENLQKSEQELQREISLLEEIMKGVKEKPTEKKQESLKEKPPPLPRKKSKNNRRATLSPRHDRYSTISSQGSISGYSDSVLLSPNLVSRLRKIPSHSKMSAPLPYVNLDKYDGGVQVDKCHVYVRNQSDDDTCSIISQRSYESESKSPKDRMSAKAKMGYGKRTDRESQKLPIDLPESNYANTECIYANDYAAIEASRQPPALPPKGPALLSKSRPLCPPPVPPGRHRAHLNKRNKYSSQYSSPRQGINPVMNPKREQNYFLMAGVDSSPSSRRRSEIGLHTPRGSSSELSDYKDGPLKVRLPKRSPSAAGKENLNPDDTCGYMDMSGMFEDERVTMKSKDEVESSTSSPQKVYTRSSSASSISENIFFRPVFQHSLSLTDTPNTPVREENYLLMHHLTSPKKSVLENLQSLQSYVSNTKAVRDSVIEGDDPSASPKISRRNSEEEASKQNTSSENAKEILKGKSSLPFPNLINFQKHNILTSSEDVHKSASATSVQSVNSDKSTENSGKSPGFLTRLIRRNSGNRKSMSQSQENLLNSSSSESCLDKTLSNIYGSRDNANGKDISTSSVASTNSSSGGQSQSEMLERRRSSSFPNRSSFMEMNASKDNFHQTSQDSFNSNGTTDEHSQLIGPQQSEQTKDTDSCESSSTNRTGYTGPCDGQTDSEDSASKSKSEGKCLSPKSFQKFRKTQEMGIFTVLRVDEPSYKMPLCQTSSKTDDEKLIDLMKYSKVKDYYGDTDSEKTNSLKSDDFKLNMCPKKAFSPYEEAAAIAKYVASLPPFIPPKQKSYPCSALSPVLESAPSLGKEEVLKEDNTLDNKSISSFRSEHSYAMIAPSDQDDAKPGEKVEESIWVPRQAVKERSPASVSSTVEDQESKSTAVVVELDHDSPSDDEISLSSSYSDSVSSESALRNSAAYTYMRPRAGNCYVVLERKRPLNESLSSSPSQTPNSPSVNSSVFTFDQVSQFSSFSRERDSPNLPKFSRSESMHSKFSERTSSHKMSYMNIDLTPPSSPPFSQSLSLPAEQLERQLNYAEIDLREKPTRKSRKSSQKSLKMQKSTSIEYAMIDMQATIAIQRAGQEHKMSRVDSLKRCDQKLSLSIPEQGTDTEDVPEPSPSSTKDETVSKEESTFLTTHKYVNVPPPKEEKVEEEEKDEHDDLPEKILLPIRENQDTSSSESEAEEDSDSSDGEVIIYE
ncbi:uncharacterized protein LOC134266347 [Saccostrea cucullata]|uniref:uncharacterized protein LOC134266347 n=1 Tax=Saccostrea cuccullata TaxID=36930 RepID=UPI002ECFBFCE